MKEVHRFSGRSQRIVGWLITLTAVLWFAWESRKRYAHHDDAYIAYRYARNLVRGNGLVWNIGEHVEGFTSLAWVLLVAAGIRMGFDAPVVSQALGVLSGSLLLCLTYVHAAARVPEQRLWVAALSPWLVWSTTAFGYWSTSGLETPLYCAAVLLSLLLIEKQRVGGAAMAAAFATLTRPDGILILGLVLLVHFSRCNWRNPKTWRLPAVCAAFMGSLTLFRLLYFHSPLPNTFYAKVGTIPFFLTSWYSLRFCNEVLAPVLLPAALGAAADPVLPLGFAWLAVTFLYVSAVGADVFDHHRFFLPAIPPLMVYAARGTSAAWEDSRILSRAAVACIPACFARYLAGRFYGATALVVLSCSSARR